MDTIEVHHAVERQVLTKPGYQGLVTEAEMHSIQNLRGIRRGFRMPNGDDLVEFHRKIIRDEWDEFYDKFEDAGTTPTKQQLLDKATEIDDKYGYIFDPPVR